ncbi:MAG: tRNA lysidine(34) synthetase TilS, partial [bacterium]
NQLVILKKPDPDFEIEVTINEVHFLVNDDLNFNADLIPKDQLPIQFAKDKNVEFVDYDKIKGALKIRNFRTGDRFRPLNFYGEKKLSDFFTDEKIPLHQRKEIPLLVCDSGIIWIMGYQIDDRFKITNQTEQILRLQLKRKLLHER